MREERELRKGGKGGERNSSEGYHCSKGEDGLDVGKEEVVGPLRTRISRVSCELRPDLRRQAT